MSKMRIQFEDDRTAFEPGETIPVTLEWSLLGAPNSLELRAVWSTVGKGTTDVGVESTVVIDNPLPSETRDVQLTLPEAPYSFSGKLVSLVWALELVATGMSASCRREITIGPDAAEVELYKDVREDAA